MKIKGVVVAVVEGGGNEGTAGPGPPAPRNPQQEMEDIVR